MSDESGFIDGQRDVAGQLRVSTIDVKPAGNLMNEDSAGGDGRAVVLSRSRGHRQR